MKRTQGTGSVPKNVTALLKNTTLMQGRSTGLENDPEIEDEIKEDAAAMQGLDQEVDTEEIMEEAFESVGDGIEGRLGLGNGMTVPYPYDGEPTLEVSTCSKPVKDVNRGCRFYGGACRLPQLAEKYGERSGSYNLRYKNLRTGQVKSAFCTVFAQGYLRLPYIVLVPPSENDPPGETWIPTRGAEYAPLPNGQQPMPGPNQPKTPIVLTPRKTRIIYHPSREMTREYQLMRRRGDFDQPTSKVVRAARAKNR